MDPLTHGIIGATAATLRVKNPKLIYVAIACGLMGGMFPDLDVVIRSAENPFVSLKYHRHFTHALAFVPLGALIVALFAHFVIFRKVKFKEIYWFCFAGMLFHGPLDTMTSYGTHLFLPFDESRIAWNTISIVDPLFTIPIFILVFITRITRNRKFSGFAACWASLYLSFGFYQHHQALDYVKMTAETRGHSIAKISASPSLGNIFAWRGQYIHRGRIYVDGHHISPWKPYVFYEGESHPYFIPSDKLLKRIGPKQQADLEFFTFFADGWVADYPTPGGNKIGDMRYAVLPNSITPLWGIELFPDKPDSHAGRVGNRQRSDMDMETLWKMVQGKALEQEPK